MKIYTKTGDAGTTGLFAGPRVYKDAPRIQAYGTVDELNACLGVVIAALPEDLSSSLLHESSLHQIIRGIQSDLFCVGAELATPDPDKQDMRMLPDSRIETIEKWIDAAEKELPTLTAFILPGGCDTAAQLHLARTICRRAEREVVSLAREPEVADYMQLVVYLNRLGDFLFVLARLANFRTGHQEPEWHKPN